MTNIITTEQTQVQFELKTDIEVIDYFTIYKNAKPHNIFKLKGKNITNPTAVDNKGYAKLLHFNTTDIEITKDFYNI